MSTGWCAAYIPTGWGTYERALKTDQTWNDGWIHSAGEWGSHEPDDGAGKEVLVAEADVARHGRVSLPEDLRHGLELGAHLDEAVQLDAGSWTAHGEALH